MSMNKLTEEELFGVQFLWRHMSNISYLEDAMDFTMLQPYFSALKDYRVVEIGPGDNPVTKHYNCKEYVAAEGYYPNDGLSVLKKEGDASGVVVSFGVIDNDVLIDKSNGVRENLTVRYINELVGEIRRVINPFGIIIGGNVSKYMGEPDIPAIDSDTELGGVYFSSNRARRNTR